MNAPLSPYAPTKAVDEAVPPRPPNKPAIFLWAAFALALTGPALLKPFLIELAQERSLGVRTLLSAGQVAFPLFFLWAFLCDRIPVFGTRREGFLMLGAGLGAVSWAATWFVPRVMGAWFGLSLAMNVTAGLMTVAIGGALVELGRTRGSTGRLAALLTIAIMAAGLVSRGLEPYLAERPLAWSASLGVAVMLSVLAMVAFSWDEPAGAPPPEPTTESYTRAQAFTGAFAVVLLALSSERVDTLRIPTLLEHSEHGRAIYDRLALVKHLAALAAAVVYLAAVRRTAAGTLLRVAVALQTLGLLGLLLVSRFPYLVFALLGLGVGATGAAVIHLAMLSTRRTREAMGYLLLAHLPRGLGVSLATVVLFWPSAPISFVLAAALSCAALLAVSLVPLPLRAVRDR